MNPEQKVAVVTDSASSMRPEYPEVKKWRVNLIPLEINFMQDGKNIYSCSDFEIKPRELYEKMKSLKELPKTSSPILGKFHKIYEKLSEKTNSIITINLSSKVSTTYETAYNAANLIKKKRPELLIEVIDSKSISLGMWFLAKHAAKLAQQEANLEEIKREVLITIPKIVFLATPATLENVIKGGRVPFLEGHAGNLLKIRPILGLNDEGELEPIGKTIGVGRARQEIVKKVKNENREIVRMGIFHTNDFQAAEEIREALAEFYSGKISIYEAGTVIGVHAGEGAIGVVFQRA